MCMYIYIYLIIIITIIIMIIVIIIYTPITLDYLKPPQDAKKRTPQANHGIAGSAHLFSASIRSLELAHHSLGSPILDEMISFN